MTRETLAEHEAQTKGRWIPEDIFEYLDPPDSEVIYPWAQVSQQSLFCSGQLEYDLPFVTETDFSIHRALHKGSASFFPET